MTSQYETNRWSTHVNIVRLAEPIRRCVRWRTQVFKIEGFVCKRFLPSPSPPPPPSFTFWLSFHFSGGQFLSISLLRNQTETLATQAIFFRELCNFFRALVGRLLLSIFANFTRLYWPNARPGSSVPVDSEHKGAKISRIFFESGECLCPLTISKVWRIARLFVNF